MKKLITILLLSVVAYLVIGGLYDNDFKFKMSSIESRDSIMYINKSVTGEIGEVVFGESTNLEDGSANMVSSIVVNYRSFDTLGEVTVLFIASLGISFLLAGSGKKMIFSNHPNFMLTTGTRVIFGFILLLGIFMMSHGHLTPGGGFPGGSLMATAFLLLYLGDEDYRAKVKKFKVLESTMGTIYVLLGLAGLGLGLTFLENFIETGTVGTLISGGLLPIIYVLIGLKVGSELIGIVDKFMNTGDEVEVAK